jgi:Holliday junction DNA helicase RuvA
VIAFVTGVLAVAGTEAVVTVGDGGLGLTLHLTSRGAAFPTVEERVMFRLLISVSGIGPRSALAILSAVSPADLAGHLQRGDESQLRRLPGVGRKNAARLVVELGSRLPAELAPTATAADVPGTAASPDGDLGAAVAVLVSMGLSAARAEQALLRARVADRGAAADLEGWVRAALRAL